MRNSLVTSLQSLVLLSVAMLAGRETVVISAPIEAVVITLRPVVQYQSAVVRLADVAEITGGDDLLRNRIAALDLDDALLAGGQAEISSRQIEFRLRLAGIDPRIVEIRGSNVLVTASGRHASTPTGSAAVRSAERQDDASRSYSRLASHSVARSTADEALDESGIVPAVMAAARECLSKQLPWPEENVVIQLAQPLPRKLLEQTVSAGTTCHAEMQTSVTPLGRVTLRVTVTTPGQRLLEVPVQLDVRHIDEVVVTTKPVARGHVFSPADLEIRRRDVTLISGYYTSLDQLVGQKAKRVLPQSQLIRAIDVEPETRTAGPVLVKQRDRVKVSARSGALVATIVGEAQQAGRAGEVIKIKNVDSNSMIYGRVLSATEVEITE
jgi:flagella basal body P-ring formation protein FlgA